MKKFLALFFLLFFGGIIIFNVASKQQANGSVVSPLVKNQQPTSFTSPSPIPATTTTTTLFVPYWSFTNSIDAKNYDTLIYFGIAPNSNGIDTSDPGYSKMKKFITLAPKNTTQLLAVRMTNSDLNSQILRNKNLQTAIIEQSIAAAKTNGFDGIVLDFEISALSFDSVVNGITAFEKQFYQTSKQNNLQFALTIYGDTFYLARPFNVKTLSQNADKIYIMAYDFSKASGLNPGPNFPLTGKTTYGYDFETMLQDFLSNAPASKLTIVYGMFGYDWPVDKHNDSLQEAESDTLMQINNHFISSCLEKNCYVTKDTKSAETKVTYTDSNNLLHVVWFEDQNSAAQKQNYARSQGISGIAYWAYSYF